jgi:hypothetical protein
MIAPALEGVDEPNKSVVSHQEQHFKICGRFEIR